MSCITSDIASSCLEGLEGGLLMTAVGEIEDVQGWTENAEGQVTAVTMKGGKKMWKLDWEDETASYDDGGIETTIGVRAYQIGYTHTIDGQFIGQDGVLKKKIDEYVKCRCGLFAINVYASGAKAIIGLRYNKEDVVGVANDKAKFIAKTTSTSGKQLTNAKMTTLKLEGRTLVPMQNFLGSIPLALAQ